MWSLVAYLPLYRCQNGPRRNAYAKLQIHTRRHSRPASFSSLLSSSLRPLCLCVIFFFPGLLRSAERAGIAGPHAFLSRLSPQHLSRRRGLANSAQDILVRKLLAQPSARRKAEHLEWEARGSPFKRFRFSGPLPWPAKQRTPEHMVGVALQPRRSPRSPIREKGNRGREPSRCHRKERRLFFAHHNFSGCRRGWPPTGRVSRLSARLG